MNIAIISCVKTKRIGQMKAKDLYCSPFFKYAYTYTSQNYDKVYILSTLYGLLEPDDIIETYELTLNKMSAQQKRDWAIRIAKQFQIKITPRDTLHYFCGINYRSNLIKTLPNQYTTPLQGLSFGRQLQWYKQRLKVDE